MTPQEKQQLLANSLKQLTTHPAFMEFVEAVKTMKDEAVASACSDKTFKTAYRTVAALGEVRAYRDILTLVDEYQAQPDPEATA